MELEIHRHLHFQVEVPPPEKFALPSPPPPSIVHKFRNLLIAGDPEDVNGWEIGKLFPEFPVYFSNYLGSTDQVVDADNVGGDHNEVGGFGGHDDNDDVGDSNSFVGDNAEQLGEFEKRFENDIVVEEHSSDEEQEVDGYLVYGIYVRDTTTDGGQNLRLVAKLFYSRAINMLRSLEWLQIYVRKIVAIAKSKGAEIPESYEVVFEHLLTQDEERTKIVELPHTRQFFFSQLQRIVLD